MTKYNNFMESSGVDISPNGFAWKDDRGSGAGKDPVIDKAKAILKKQSPETFQALVNDQDNPNDVGDSDLVRGQAAAEDGTNLPDSSVNVKANGKRLGYVDTAKGQFIKEALSVLDAMTESLTKLIEDTAFRSWEEAYSILQSQYSDFSGEVIIDKGANGFTLPVQSIQIGRHGFSFTHPRSTKHIPAEMVDRVVIYDTEVYGFMIALTDESTFRFRDE